MRLRHSVVKSVLLSILLSLLVSASLPQSPFIIPEVKAQGEGNITFQPNVIPFLTITDRPLDKPESFRFEWNGNRFDIELFFNATVFKRVNEGTPRDPVWVWKNVTKLWSLQDFEVDFNLSVQYRVSKNETHGQFGWFIENLDSTNEWVHEAWFKIEDTRPFDYNNITLETIEPMPPLLNYTITRFHLPDNLVLSFEDLYHKGFIIGYQNKTATSVKGFSGKSSWNLDPIVLSGNYIVVTGYTEATPATFTDLYNADKAGTIALEPSTAYSTNTTITLDQQIRPADSLGLRINFVVTAITGTIDVSVAGLDKDSVAQSESFVMSTIQTYTTTKWYKSIDTNGITLTIMSGESTTFNITQSRWGVIWKQSSTQFILDATLLVGQGSDTYFADKNKQITIRSGAITLSYIIFVLEKGRFWMGNVVDETNKITNQGVSFVSEIQLQGVYLIQGYSAGGFTDDIRLYSSSFVAPYSAPSSGTYRQYIYNIHGRIWNTIFSSAISPFNVDVDAYRVTVQSTMFGFLDVTGTFDDILIQDTYYGIYASGSNTFTLKNAKNYRSTYYFFFYIRTVDAYLINVESESWAFGWSGTNTAKWIRQYEFDLNVTTSANIPISSANVTVKYYGQGGGTAFSVLTGANGSFATKTLSRSFYQQSTGNTENSYNPFQVSVSKSGYQTKKWNFTLAEKTDWQVSLEPNISPVAKFTFTPSNPQPNEAVTFDGTSSIDPNGTISSYNWTLGDGSSSTSSSFMHRYQSDGTYTVTLTVTDNQDATNSFSQTIKVSTLISAGPGGVGTPPGSQPPQPSEPPKPSEPEVIYIPKEPTVRDATLPFIIGVIASAVVISLSYTEKQRRKTRKNVDRFQGRKRNPWEP